MAPVKQCQQCNARFGPFDQKKVCKGCSKVVCDLCLQIRVVLPNVKEVGGTKVCSNCADCVLVRGEAPVRFVPRAAVGPSTALPTSTGSVASVGDVDGVTNGAFVTPSPSPSKSSRPDGEQDAQDVHGQLATPSLSPIPSQGSPKGDVDAEALLLLSDSRAQDVVKYGSQAVSSSSTGHTGAAAAFAMARMCKLCGISFGVSR